MAQVKMPEGKSRLTIRIRGSIKKEAKIKAIRLNTSLENVVDKLLAAWVAGKVIVNVEAQEDEAGQESGQAK